jgi:flagellar biosynthesis protein FlhF
MNVKRFTARTSRDALTLVRQAFGDDAVVLSTRPCADGVEVLAMAPDGVEQIARMAESTMPTVRARAAAPAAPAAADVKAPRSEPARAGLFAAARSALAAMPAAGRSAQRAAASAPADVEKDVEQLAMSTLSFQDYVRERMLKRRQAALQEAAGTQAGTEPALADASGWMESVAPSTAEPVAAAAPRAAAPSASAAAPRAAAPASSPARAPSPSPKTAPKPHAVPRLSETVEPAPAAAAMPQIDTQAPARDRADVMNELRSMKGLIEQRFGALAFMDKLQREPRHAMLTGRLLDYGFSPALTRKLVDALPATGDETAWATSVLERNLLTGEADPALEDIGGVYALIGSTGVGKTTTTAKIAAAFAAKHGAAHLGLITLDAYRVGAQEQLRAYGRILGVPVHTAHDRASLEDLLELLAAKKMVLIDTAGMAQRDARTRELFEMLSHRAIQKLLVLDASSQGETIDEVIVSWRASTGRGVLLSKIDEAVKLGPALDAVIRHRLTVLGVANGQRVPEDWHRLSAHALVHRALRAAGSSAYRMDAGEVQLVFSSAAAGDVPARTPAHSPMPAPMARPAAAAAAMHA